MKETNINDYVDLVHEKFPEVSKEDIKRILVYGWKMILLYLSAGNDISVLSPKEFYFFGSIPKNSLNMFSTYCYKLSKRIRYMFKRTKADWDGYYYFARSESLYLDYLKQNKKRNKVFKDVFLYKLLEQAELRDPAHPYIFRIKDSKIKLGERYFSEIKTRNAELIVQRDPLTMADIKVSTNKYKYI